MKVLQNVGRYGPVVLILAVVAVPATALPQQTDARDGQKIAAAEARNLGEPAKPEAGTRGDEPEGGADDAEPAADAGAAPAVEAQQGGRPGGLRPSPLQVEERSVFGNFRAFGDVQVAYQTSSVDGSAGRFRKDFGLNDGVRLKNSTVTFVPHGDNAAGWFDRIQFQGDNVGGNDKYQSWGLRASKSGSYKLSVRDRRLNWFNDITGETNAWNTTRHLTDANLAVNLTSSLVLNGRFNRYRQTDGDDTPEDGGDFVEPYDQTGTDWGVGLRWRVGQTVLFANQDFRKFRNEGIEAGRFEDLREMTAPVTRAGINTRVADGRVLISGDLLYSKQEMEFGSALGGAAADVEGGTADRKIAHGNVRVNWSASERFNIYAQYRRRGWDQDAVNAGSSSDELTSYKITINQIFGGVEWAATRGIALFGEVGTGSREQRLFIDDEGPDSTTDALGVRFGGRFRAGMKFDASVSFELGDIDNAFTRVSPTKANTFKAKLRYRPAPAWTLAATATVSKSENDCGQVEDGVCEYGPGGLFDGDFGIAEFDTSNIGVTVNYTLDAGRWIYAGYTHLDYDSNVPIYFVFLSSGNFQRDVARYDSRSSIWTLGGEYQLSSSTPLSLYGRLNVTSSSGTYAVDFNDIGVGARYVLPVGLFVDVSARFAKFSDNSLLPSNVDDYDAQIYTFGLGYRF